MNRHSLSRLLGAGLIVLASCGPAGAADEAQRLGVASCASSTCHGRVSPANNSYAQLNEYFLWSKYDRHAQAYRTLEGDWSKRIAANMGIADAARAPECLVCHSDYVPEAQRGPRFQLSDGVGCEACHGSASGYIDAHYGPDASHAENIALGLTPSENPRVQAQICQSCHVGDKQRLVTHEIMAAGHPRLRFELDTWLTNMPVHHSEDADYAQRKGITNGADRWAAGIAAAAVDYMDMLQAHLDGHSLTPELGLFDCHACHRPMDTTVRRTSGEKWLTPAGSIRPNDYAIRTLAVVAGLRDAALADRISQQNRTLHRSTSQSVARFKNRSADLRDTLIRAQAVVASRPLSASERAAVRRALLQTASEGYFRDYADAEQLFLALQALAAVSEADRAGQYDRLFGLLTNEQNFKPSRVAAEAGSLLR